MHHHGRRPREKFGGKNILPARTREQAKKKEDANNPGGELNYFRRPARVGRPSSTLDISLK